MCHPKMPKSSHLMHILKNHSVQGMIVPSSIGWGPFTGVVIGMMNPTALDELEVVEEGGEVMGPGVNVVIWPSELVNVIGVEMPVGRVNTPLVSEMIVSPLELVVVVADGGGAVVLEAPLDEDVEELLLLGDEKPDGTKVMV